MQEVTDRGNMSADHHVMSSVRYKKHSYNNTYN